MYGKLLFVLAFFTCVQSGEGRASPSAADELAVRAVVSKLASTTQDESADERAALFAHDAQIINAFGNRADGRKEIYAFWTQIFESGMFRTARSEEKELKVRFLTDSVALVDRFYIFSGQRGPRSGRELPPRDIHATLIMRKDHGRWLIIYYSVADLRTLRAQSPR